MVILPNAPASFEAGDTGRLLRSTLLTALVASVDFLRFNISDRGMFSSSSSLLSLVDTSDTSETVKSESESLSLSLRPASDSSSERSLRLDKFPRSLTLLTLLMSVSSSDGSGVMGISISTLILFCRIRITSSMAGVSGFGVRSVHC